MTVFFVFLLSRLQLPYEPDFIPKYGFELRKKTFTAALTGGIGCGKSFVLQAFAECGAAVVSADAVAGDLRRKPEVIARFADILGKDVLLQDGSGIDTAAVADRIFSSPEAKIAVEELMHPLIRNEIRERAERIAGEKEGCILVAEVPLLFESGWESDFDCTVAVWCREDMIPRRMEERSWNRNEYLRRAASQLSADTKLHKAQYGIINNGSAGAVVKQCAELMSIWSTMEE